ncbi:MAG TPA: hypothetical protein EYP10_04790 [Armatimonadetes bacterium]|nr:hypothetical protein [Armatimonadota bacterium]
MTVNQQINCAANYNSKILQLLCAKCNEVMRPKMANRYKPESPLTTNKEEEHTTPLLTHLARALRSNVMEHVPRTDVMHQPPSKHVRAHQQRCCPEGHVHHRCVEIPISASNSNARCASPELLESLLSSPDAMMCIIGQRHASYESYRRLQHTLASEIGRWLSVVAEQMREVNIESESTFKHPPLVNTLRNASYDRIIFMDCETLGLGYQPVFLIGALIWHVCNAQAQLHQWLAHDYSEELFVIKAFLDCLRPTVLLVTFNGKAFDIPLLRARAMRYRLEWSEPATHIDLLHYSRRLWRHRLPNCRLSTLSERLHYPRIEYPTSAEMPEWYRQFIESCDPYVRDMLLLHNAVDTCALVPLLYAVMWCEGLCPQSKQCSPAH